MVIMAGIIVLLDQITKWLVVHSAAYTRPVTVVPGLLWFTYRENTGAAFSILTGNTHLLALLTVIILVALAVTWRRVESKLRGARLGLFLALGGSIGNLIDRVRVGAVIDWIQIPYWPVFNVADAAIVIGVGFLIWHLQKI